MFLFKWHSLKKITGVVIVVFSIAHITILAAVSSGEAVKSRRVNYKEIGGAFKAISDEVKTGAPLIDVIKPAAGEIVRRGVMQSEFFPAGSGPESGEKTLAKPAIWTERVNFLRMHQDFVAAAERLNTAIDGGDIKVIAAAHKSLGATCKSCHDRYREPD